MYWGKTPWSADYRFHFTAARPGPEKQSTMGTITLRVSNPGIVSNVIIKLLLELAGTMQHQQLLGQEAIQSAVVGIANFAALDVNYTWTRCSELGVGRFRQPTWACAEKARLVFPFFCLSFILPFSGTERSNGRAAMSPLCVESLAGPAGGA